MDPLPDRPRGGDVRALAIPIPHDGVDWTPQGLGHHEASDSFVHSMYDHDDQQRGLLAIQPADGGRVRYARVSGNAHYGGVSVSGDQVYVSGNGARGETGTFVQRYSLARLLEAGGEVVRPEEKHATAAGSTLTVWRDRLYVGRYRNGEPGRIHEYALGPGGTLPRSEVDWAPVREWDSPPNMQGLVRHGPHLYITRSHGVRRRSSIYRFDLATGDHHRVARAGVLSQGLVIRRGRLVITSESGAGAYRRRVADSTPPWLAGLVSPPVLPQHHLQEIGIPR